MLADDNGGGTVAAAGDGADHWARRRGGTFIHELPARTLRHGELHDERWVGCPGAGASSL